MSLLSTEWKLPSTSVTATSTTGWPSGPFFGRRLRRLPHRGDEAARHGAADHLVLEGEAGAARPAADMQLHVGELAMPAGLPLQPRMLGDRAGGWSRG